MRGRVITIGLDLAWTWKPREIRGMLSHVGRDYVTMERPLDGREYHVPLNQILYVTGGEDVG
jgi:hypothetical protein